MAGSEIYNLYWLKVLSVIIIIAISYVTAKHFIFPL